ncbi:hypothetical protein ACC703_39325, partial [Rhizobium ruizarguesonis]
LPGDHRLVTHAHVFLLPMTKAMQSGDNDAYAIITHVRMLRMGIFSVDECAADDLTVLILLRRTAK